MKKFILVLAVLLAAAPAMAQTTFSAVAEGDGVVAIYYDATAEAEWPRAFALDFVVTDGNTAEDPCSMEDGGDPGGNITAVSDYHTGESNKPPGSLGFGIFPASFNRYINADDPNWADVNYTPEADPCDLPGGTQGGIGTSGITIEMGSLYVGEANAPPKSGLLCKVKIAPSGASDRLNVHANVARALTGVVLEDGTDSSTNVQDSLWVYVFPRFLDGDIAGPTRGRPPGMEGMPDGNIDVKDQDKLNLHWGPSAMPYSPCADVAGPTRGRPAGMSGKPDGVVDVKDQDRLNLNWGT